MKVLGITGGIGSGKSTVVEIIQELKKVLYINTDELARKNMEKTGESYDQIVSMFGKKIVDKNGDINRNILAEIVFSSQEQLEKLNQCTHSKVVEQVRNLVSEGKKSDYEYILIESALFIEANFADICDEIWCITANSEVRTERLIQTRGYKKEKVDNIVQKQKSNEDYFQICTKIIENNQNKIMLYKKIKNELDFWEGHYEEK